MNFHSHPIPTGSNLPEGQMASLDYDPAHAYPGCQGYFEWEGEVKMAKHSCWGCGAQDEFCYWVEPIVEGTNAGGHMEVASTPELANLGHLVYQLNNKVAFLEQRLGQEEKKVAELEVINQELAVGFVHLMEFHVGPSETALWAAATAFLPFLFGCKSVKFGCKSSTVSDGQSGEAFAGGVRSGNSSSSNRVPPLIPCSTGDPSSSSISPLSSSSSKSVVISSGGSLWAYLLPVREVEEDRAEVLSVEVDHSVEVEGSGEGSSGPSPNVSESSSGWWFSPTRWVLPEL